MAAAIASRSPMALTVLVITYNAPRAAEICLGSLLACGDALAGGEHGERGAQPAFGVLRPRSGHMDFAAKMALAPPTPVRDQDDAETFAAAVREQFGGQVVGWPALIGDAMFIRRAVLEKVGGMDPRFYGY